MESEESRDRRERLSGELGSIRITGVALEYATGIFW